MPKTIYQSTLYPASFNGIQFFVVDATAKVGQRVAAHEFPMRQVPYNEPLGRANRNYTFTAFIVGDAAQLHLTYELLLAEFEAGPGSLVHPIFGQLQAICVQAETTMNTGNRHIEMRLSFVESGSVIYPSNLLDTQSDVIRVGGDAQTTSSDNFESWAKNPTPAAPADPAPGSGTPAQVSLNDFGDRAVSSPTSDFGVA